MTSANHPRRFCCRRILHDLRVPIFVFLLCCCWSSSSIPTARFAAAASAASSSSSTTTSSTTSVNNIHAVIVSSSRYWFNYRHFVNALSIYRILKENGIPDSNIILMLADEIPSNSRNPNKNDMFPKGITGHSLYNESVEVDYRGADVTVENLFHILLGTTTATGGKDDSRSTSSTGRVLHTNQDSNVVLYMTGHGGDQFFKFQDEEEITSYDFANVVNEMYLRGKYKKLLFITDTCQAFTLVDRVTSPNVFTVASSLRDESAYAHHVDHNLGLAVIERYTHGIVEYYYNHTNSKSTVYDVLVKPFASKELGGNGIGEKLIKKALGATIGVKDDLGSNGGTLKNLLMSDFFGPPLHDTQQMSKKKKEQNQKTSTRQQQQQLQSNDAGNTMNAATTTTTTTTTTTSTWKERRPSSIVHLDMSRRRRSSTTTMTPQPPALDGLQQQPQEEERRRRRNDNVVNDDHQDDVSSRHFAANSGDYYYYYKDTSEEEAMFEPTSPEFLGIVASLVILVIAHAIWDDYYNRQNQQGVSSPFSSSSTTDDTLNGKDNNDKNNHNDYDDGGHATME